MLDTKFVQEKNYRGMKTVQAWLLPCISCEFLPCSIPTQPCFTCPHYPQYTVINLGW